MADNQSSSDTTTGSTPLTGSSETGSSFGDDDLGRIQGILFGDHARKTEERLNVMEIALLGAIADLREETAKSIEAIEAKLVGEADTRERALSNLGSRVGRDIADQTAKVDDLAIEIESVETNVKHSVESVESAMGVAMAEAKAVAQRDIEAARIDIGSGKVDRTDLARMLRQLGEDIDKTAGKTID